MSNKKTKIDKRSCGNKIMTLYFKMTPFVFLLLMLITPFEKIPQASLPEEDIAYSFMYEAGKASQKLMDRYPESYHTTRFIRVHVYPPPFR